MRGLERGSVAIVGAAESDLGAVAPNTSPIDLMAQATRRALDDCGLKLTDIDGIFAATTQARSPTLYLREYLGIEPRYADNTMIGGSSFESHIGHAQAAIRRAIAIVGGDWHGARCDHTASGGECRSYFSGNGCNHSYR